jgi:rhamnose utilization protein RhaD (predicted bifunctional aldolase and dehydrogenase)
MNSRWDDATAAALGGLDLLVYASRLIGAESSLVVWGGGNTSLKQVERDHRGRECRVLRVKGSGSDLKSIQKKDFPGVRMDDIEALLPRDDMGDTEMVDYLRFALQDPGGSRPSIETLLHGFLPAPAVSTPTPMPSVSLTNNANAGDVLREVYRRRGGGAPVSAPGFRISQGRGRYARARPRLRAMLLQKHGTICWGATVKEAYSPPSS